MKSKKYHPKSNSAKLVRNTFLFGFFLLYVFFGLNRVSAQSSPEFIQGTDTLTVYSDVPGLTASPKYSIRVRSAATGNVWKDCFANYTYNVHDFVSDPNLAGTNTSNPSNRQNYQSFTRNWSHTYGNIEMSKNQTVEVEISKINGTSFVAIGTAAIHPEEKATPAIITDGKVYFTLYNPAQIVIDIDGQMDSFNKGLDDNTPTLDYVAHTISLFANPVIKKPSLGNPRVLNIGVSTPSYTYDPTLYDIISFGPGVHTGYQNFKVYPDKTYYIPGDAIVYGTFNNIGQTAVAQNIKIYGYGTVSGTGIINPAYVLGADEEIYKSVAINNCMNVEVQGVCFVDPAYHTINIDAWGARPNKTVEVTFTRWVKVISWRGNGDGIGSAHLVEDCFLRTADDASYVKGNRKRCTIWKDFNAAAFNFSSIPDPASSFPIVIEDCDIIYNRSSATNPLAGVFVQRAAGLPAVQRKVNVTFKNIRISDPKPNTPVFNLFSKDSTRISGTNPVQYSMDYGSSYSGIKFQNITITSPPPTGKKQRLTGHGDTDTSGAAAFGPAPWYGGIIFDNVTISGRKLNIDDFNSNDFVKDIFFSDPIVINTPGTSSWVAPAGVTSISVEAWGGGGGGGGATTNNYGGGGAGGSYVKNTNVPVVPLTSYTVTIGAGGAASGTGGANGNPGGTTTFGSTVPVIANGGVAGGGTNSSALGVGGINTSAGSGGTGTLGANGSNAVTLSSGAGGKGGGFTGGAGGASKTTFGAGNAGASPGGGGSGAFGAGSGSRAGGAGGAGSVRISYTASVADAPIIGTATASGSSGQALVSFTAPAFSGNSLITSYTATSNPGGLTGTINQAGSGVITVSGLTNGTSYTFTVKATNSEGQSPASAASNEATPVKTSQSITFSALPSKTIGDTDFSPGATASSGLTVSYVSSNTAVATIVNGLIRIVGVGTATITASQVGDTNYNAALSVSQSITVSKANQSITFSALPSKTIGDTDFSPGATASSGLTVSYVSSNTAVATIVNGLIRIVGVGTATITASQVGDTNYNAALSVSQSITVSKANQSITFSALPSKTIGDTDFSPGATASSGLTVSYVSSNTAVATIVNGLIRIVGVGTATITASQVGDTNYNAALSVSQSVTVSKANQSITFSALPTKTVGDTDFSPGATASSGLTVSYVSSNTAVATIVNGLIRIVGAGTSTITASQVGNTNYNPATNVSQTLTVMGPVVTTYAPTSFTVLLGTRDIGTVSRLALNDNSVMVFNSSTSGTRSSDWYSSTIITQAPSSVTKLTINYDGKYSISRTQLLYLYNWSTSSWTQIDSRTVSTTDVLVTNIQNSPVNFISPTGEIRLRVFSSGGSKNYTCSADWVRFTVENSSSFRLKQDTTSKTVSSNTTKNFKVFPSPATGFSNFEYSIPTEGKVQLSIYNLNGQMIKTIVNNETHLSGNYTKEFNVSGLGNGVYIAQLKVGSEVKIIKVIVKN